MKSVVSFSLFNSRLLFPIAKQETSVSSDISLEQQVHLIEY